MKVVRNIRLALVILLLIFGSSFIGHQSPCYVKLADKITAQTAKQLKKQKQLCLVGTGGGMMHDVQMLAMSFYFYQEVDLKTARELVVTAVNEYLSEVNNNKEIRPYLHDYPFTAKNIEIRIWSYKPDGSYPLSNKIQCISAIKGILSYYTSPDKYSSEVIHKETYEEALQLVNHETHS